MKRYIIGLDEGTTSARTLIYDTKEKIHYALNIADMGSVLEGCMSVYDSEYKLLKKAFEQQKEASTGSRKDNNEAD